MARERAPSSGLTACAPVSPAMSTPKSGTSSGRRPSDERQRRLPHALPRTRNIRARGLDRKRGRRATAPDVAGLLVNCSHWLAAPRSGMLRLGLVRLWAARPGGGTQWQGALVRLWRVTSGGQVDRVRVDRRADSCCAERELRARASGPLRDPVRRGVREVRVAAACAVLVVLAGCGGSGGESSSADPAATATPSGSISGASASSGAATAGADTATASVPAPGVRPECPAGRGHHRPPLSERGEGGAGVERTRAVHLQQSTNRNQVLVRDVHGVGLRGNSAQTLPRGG